MPDKSAVLAEAARLRALFQTAGATVVEADVLQPADTLLDLYGEDIRARAFTTTDPFRGEVMLRPDFTVPVVQRHMAGGADPARYTYSGEVFRRQEDDPDRPAEFIQVGFELFDRTDPAKADAEVFALFADILAPLPLRAATGDIGLLTAAVRGLNTTERRKAALLRHIWRPARFRALLDRFAGITAVPATRAALLAADDPLADTAPEIGLRRRAEVITRIEALRADAEAPPLGGELDLLTALLAIRAPLSDALAPLGDIAADLPAIQPTLDLFTARLEALNNRGIDLASIDFEGSFGRTSLEYYDGFVFGFYAIDRADLPAVASGGRYDALTRALGQGDTIPAVGGVIRPTQALEVAL
jgi:ATP phosphoribosyltransferase regulatory subunit